MCLWLTKVVGWTWCWGCRQAQQEAELWWVGSELVQEDRKGWAGPFHAICWPSVSCVTLLLLGRLWMTYQENINFSSKICIWGKSSAIQGGIFWFLLISFMLSPIYVISINCLLELTRVFIYVVCMCFRQKKLMDLSTYPISLWREHLNAKKSSKLSIIFHKTLSQDHISS